MDQDSWPKSVLLIDVSEVDALVEEWRTQHDPAFARNLPCHITLLFPFLPVTQIGEPVLDALASFASGFEPISFALTAVDEFPGALWLRPEPFREFSAMSKGLQHLYPECQPYGGQYPDSVPHLTVAVTADETLHEQLRAEIEDKLASELPLQCKARAISLFTGDVDDRWSRLATFPLRG